SCRLIGYSRLPRSCVSQFQHDPRRHQEGFHRVRPYNLDKTLHPICKTKTKDDAYPSGHTTSGFLLALTLIDIVPEKRDAILARAEDYGRNRLVCGVHYPSDIQASKLVAYTIHAIMEVNPQYQKELVEAKAEVRRVLGFEAQAAK
ncbi:phosphatase PAP2 family protein, partial [Methylosinus sporium]|uniref:phosphatase PAP2 family protein n=1 Tax=Methylosinus sporium TaxID=428 RepID=UPI00132F8E9C